MLYAILADIHSNLEALTAVLEDMEKKGGVDEIWYLGDIVGYGPDPGECIGLLQRYKPVCIAGNHDYASVGKVDTSYFNPLAAAACRWTSGQLGGKEKKYLDSLPLTLEKGDFTLVHGSPMEPLWEYVVSTGIAARNFNHFRSPYCLVGHSHVPVAFREEGGSYLPTPFAPGIGMILGKSRMIINPGGVGQPRDGDPRASYAIYDDESKMIRLYRVPYNIEATQEKMMRVGLPVQLITRLKEGR